MSRESLPQTRNAFESAAIFPSLQQEMNRLLEQFRTGFPALNDQATSAFAAAAFPALDMVETDDAVEITAELPGVAEEDLEVTVNGNMLVLKGEKKTEHEHKEDAYTRTERRYGSFRRSLDLGFVPEDGSVKAAFADGVLKLSATKPEKAKAAVQKVAIQKA